MKVAIGSDPFGIEDWEAFADFVVEAERLGVDCIWAAETWAYDAATPLAFLAARTRRIRLGTGVMQLGARSPAMIAMTATALAAIEDARQRLLAAVLAADPAARLDITWAHREFGALNWREWLLFARVHTLDHARQLQAIAAALATGQG